MSVVVVGTTHRSANLALLERLAVPADEGPVVLKSLLGLEHVAEAVVVSTCNRVEVYAHLSRFHAGLDELRGWMADRAGVDHAEFDDTSFVHFDTGAAAHLFRVASGTESMVVGEQQILTQVRAAMEEARAEGAARTVLQRLFRQAVRVGRRVRRETDIDLGASSMVDVGIDVALHALGRSLDGAGVLVVGAGTMGGLAADRLRQNGTERRLVWNRSAEKADRLAARIGGLVAPSLRDALAEVDLVVCTTGAPAPLLEAADVARAVALRGRDTPLVVLDLGMPRNVAPAAGQVEGVTLVDIAAVREVADRTVTGDVLDAANAIVDEEAEAFATWMRAREVDPTIRELRGRAEQVRLAEMERLAARLSGLDDRQRDAVEALTRGIVNTLLHGPTVRLKSLADNDSAEHAVGALRDLFDLEEPS